MGHPTREELEALLKEQCKERLTIRPRSRLSERAQRLIERVLLLLGAALRRRP